MGNGEWGMGNFGGSSSSMTHFPGSSGGRSPTHFSLCALCLRERPLFYRPYLIDRAALEEKIVVIHVHHQN